MARGCGCAGTTCSCKVEAASGSPITVSGIGTATDPYVIDIGAVSASGLIAVQDTSTVYMTLTGAGTTGNPYRISGSVPVGASVVSVATDGGTTVVGSNQRSLVLAHPDPIAAHTILLPSTNTTLLQEVVVATTAGVTSLTVEADTGSTVVNAPTTMPDSGFFRMGLFGTVWTRIG